MQINTKGAPLRKRELNTAKRYADYNDSPLKGKVFCGHCGHGLRISCTKNAAFHCWFTRSAPDAPCHHLRASKRELEQAVFKMISRQAEVVLGNAESFAPCEEAAKKKADCMARIEGCYNQKRGLYECLIRGKMDAEVYQAEKNAIEVEIDRLEQVFAAMKEHAERQAADAKVQKIACKVGQADGLTPELVHLLIERVLLYPGGHLEVYWKVAAFDNTQKNTGGMTNAR